MNVTRTRSRDERVATKITWDEYKSNPSVHNSGQFSGSLSGKTVTIQDFPHANFRKRIEAGEAIWGDLYLTSWERTAPSSSVTLGPGSDATHYTETETGDLSSLVESQFAPDRSLSSDLPRMFNAALIKAYANIHQDQVVSGEALSDMTRTIGMLSRPFGQARNLLSRMASRSGRLSRRASHNASSAAASAWLEYRYGWKPLVLDTQQIIKNTQSFRERLYKRRLVSRSTVSQTRTTSRAIVDHIPPFLSEWRMSGGVTDAQECKAHAGVLYEVANRTSSQQLASDFSLTSRDLVTTAWELVPYSFVVDWFCSIGDWLQAIMPDPAISVKGNWVTCKSTYITSYNGGPIRKTGWIPPGASANIGNWTGATVKVTNVERQCNQPIPPPPLNFNFSSVTHAIDGAALSLNPLIESLRRFRR